MVDSTMEDTSSIDAETRPTLVSGTFSIDFAVSAQEDPDKSLESLRESHERAIDNMLPSFDDTDDFLHLFPTPTDTFTMPTPHSSMSFSSPSPSTPASQPIESLQGKPQFNLASAESLLSAFRTMLPHFPCIIIPEDATVSHLAATKPFVLLAILAATSGSRSLQGQNLYDDEFRKVLGLKFVAGGERTLELLQGILIYCAW